MGAARISMYDEASLSWYFGEGQAAFERSVCGSMLERCDLYAVAHVPDPELVALRAAREPWEPPVGEVDARPRGGQPQSSGYTPDELALSRYARVSRRLLAVSRADLHAAHVLAAYYGDTGARWGRTPQGRIFAVLPLTEAGLEILRRATRRMVLRPGANADDQINAELTVQAVQPVPGRALLIERARKQATEAYDHASRVWVEIGAAQRAAEEVTDG